jgi:hypothetical protein
MAGIPFSGATASKTLWEGCSAASSHVLFLSNSTNSFKRPGSGIVLGLDGRRWCLPSTAYQMIQYFFDEMLIQRKCLTQKRFIQSPKTIGFLSIDGIFHI